MEKIKQFINDIKLLSVEGFFIILLLIAIIRLCFMQCFPHPEYMALADKSAVYSEPVGEIQDRHGNSIVREAERIDLKMQYPINDVIDEIEIPETNYATSIYNIGNSHEYRSCSDEKYGLSKSWPLGKYRYKIPCSILRRQNAYRNKIFQDSFIENNQTLQNIPNPRDLDSKKIKEYNYKSLPFADYLEYQKQLREIYDIRYISGFKFKQLSNDLLNNICINKDKHPLKDNNNFQRKIEKIKVKELKNADVPESGKDKTIKDYCSSKTFEDKVILSIIPKEIFEKNKITYYALSEVSKNTENKDLKADIKAGKYDDKLNGKSYCRNNFKDELCRELYAWNLERIEKFFETRRSHFNIGEIKNKISQANKEPRTESAVELQLISADDYYKLLPEVHFLADNSGTYWTDGITFEKHKEMINMLGTYKVDDTKEVNASDADVLRFDKSGKLKQPLREKTKPADYMMPSLLGLNLAGHNIFEVLKAETDKNLFYVSSENEENDLKEEYCQNNKKDEKNNSKRKADYKPDVFVYNETEKMLKVLQCNAKDENGTNQRRVWAWRGIAAKYFEELKKEKNSIQLTIDADIQAFTEMQIRQRCEELKADRGFAIIQNVNSGELLAMAEYSSPYSKYLYEGKKEEEYKRYSLWALGYPAGIPYRTYKPGSTFKPFSLAFALQDGSIKSDEKIPLLKEFLSLKNSKDTDMSAAWDEIHEHGSTTKMPPSNTTPQNIIAKSSNIGTAYIAYRMWQKKDKGSYPETVSEWENKLNLIKWAKAFGFGQKTGFEDDISVLESEGHIKPMENDKCLYVDDPRRKEDTKSPYCLYDPKIKGDKKNASGKTMILKDYLKTAYGQGPMDVTPLQLITAYSALINGGTLYKPCLIKSKCREGKKIEGFSESTSAIIRKYMKAVMECNKERTVCGTGWKYKPKEFDMGGKSGTADIAIPGKKQDNGKKKLAYLSSFAGFFPYENPEYMILVMIDENEEMGKNSPKYRLEGADAAAPVVKRLAEELHKAVQEKKL